MLTIPPSLGPKGAPSYVVDTLIIGAGPSGLAAACRLVEAGLRPVIVEKSTNFGGLMRSIQHGSFVVDLGRKELYSRIPEVDTLWNNLLGQDYRPYPHRVGSLYGGRILEMSGAFRGLRRGMTHWSFLRGAIDLGQSWVVSGFRKPATYQDYWYQRAGEQFARTLAQGYWEKFRGQRWVDMPAPDVLSDGRSAQSYSFGAIAHGVKLAVGGGPSSQRQWRHPARGTGQICSAQVNYLRNAGVEVKYETDIIAMHPADHSIACALGHGPSGQIRFQAKSIISSLQIEALIALIDGRERHKTTEMRYRTVILVYLFLEEEPRFPHAWLEVNDMALNCGRITNYAAFNGEMVPPGRTALCVEFFLDSEDQKIGKADKEWVRLAISECAFAALIDPSKLSDSLVVRLARTNAAASWREAQETSRLQLFGQIEAYRNLFHVYRPGTDWATFAGMMAAEAIISGERHNFDRRADPTRSYTASHSRPETGEEIYRSP